MRTNTLSALNPAKYRAWIEHCAAQGLAPIPAHSVTDSGCWQLVKPIAPNANGYIAIGRSINGNLYRMMLHTLSLIHAESPAIYRRIDAIQADGTRRAMACHKPICAMDGGAGKACFNPSHLRLDDALGNARDTLRDGNVPRGAAHYAAKLTDAQANAIRAEAAVGAAQRALARKYGVSQSAISNIVKRRAYANADGRLL